MLDWVLEAEAEAEGFETLFKIIGVEEFL